MVLLRLRFRVVLLRLLPPFKEKVLLELIGYGIISVPNLKKVPPSDTFPIDPGHKSAPHGLPI